MLVDELRIKMVIAESLMTYLTSFNKNYNNVSTTKRADDVMFHLAGLDMLGTSLSADADINDQLINRLLT